MSKPVWVLEGVLRVIRLKLAAVPLECLLSLGGRKAPKKQRELISRFSLIPEVQAFLVFFEWTESLLSMRGIGSHSFFRG